MTDKDLDTVFQRAVPSWLMLLLLIPLGLLDACVAKYGWNTFVVPTFGGPRLTIMVTWGLLVFFNYLITKRRDMDNSKTSWNELIGAVFIRLWSWLIMFLLHFFI